VTRSSKPGCGLGSERIPFGGWVGEEEVHLRGGRRVEVDNWEGLIFVIQFPLVFQNMIIGRKVGK